MALHTHTMRCRKMRMARWALVSRHTSGSTSQVRDTLLLEFDVDMRCCTMHLPSSANTRNELPTHNSDAFRSAPWTHNGQVSVCNHASLFAGVYVVITSARAGDELVWTRHWLRVCPQQRSNLWSDPCSWGQVPGAGDHAVIPAGEHIVLDAAPPPLASLTVRFQHAEAMPSV